MTEEIAVVDRPSERGCGTRQENSLYLTIESSPFGKDISWFLVDPAIEWNGPQTLRAPMFIEDKKEVTHLILGVGKQYYPFVCVPKNEILLGDNKPIQQYEQGNMVIGSNGLQMVMQKFSRPYSGPLIEIKARGMLPLKVTPEHPILTVRGFHYGNHWTRVRHTAPKWKWAKALVEKHCTKNGDYLVIPRIEGFFNDKEISLTPYISNVHNRILLMRNRGLPTTFPIDTETAWVLGLYVAEGSSANNGWNVALGSDENDLVKKFVSICRRFGYSIHISRRRSRTQILVPSVVLARFLRNSCGHLAPNKKIPDFILFHKNLKILQSFLEGYIAGDGCVTQQKGRRVIIFNTVSKVLVQQIQLAYARLGLFIAIRKSRDKQEGEIRGRKVSLNEQFEGKLAIDSERPWLHGDYFYLPIVKIKGVDYEGTVYNIKTTDNTYLVNNAIVHNCDFVEEARRLGVSKRVPRNIEVERLSSESKFLLMHPRAIPRFEYEASDTCPKHKLDKEPHECVGFLWSLSSLKDFGNVHSLNDGTFGTVLIKTPSSWYEVTKPKKPKSFVDQYASGIILAFPLRICNFEYVSKQGKAPPKLYEKIEKAGFQLDVVGK